MGSDDLHKKRSAAKRKPKGDTQLRRRGSTRQPNERILIVCEDSKSAADYFKAARRYFGLTSVVVSGDCGSAPINVVESAKQKYDESVSETNSFDHVYCVFDRDTHPTYQKALNCIKTWKSQSLPFEAITSVPCFEYWLLLHFTCSTKPYHATGKNSASDKVKKELKVRGRLPGYTKADA